MNRKFVSIFLLIALISLNLTGLFYPKNIQAQTEVPVKDAKSITTQIANAVKSLAKTAWKYAKDHASRWAVKVADWAWQEALAAALAIVKKKILDMLVNEIIVWIQGGGEPKFITDWWGFLSEATGEAAQKFVRELTGTDICSPFKPQILIALEEPQTFGQRAACTLDDIVGNIENFYEDFRYGGWEGWIKITEPQNNFYGAFLMAQDRQIELMSQAKEAAQAKGIAGAGWLGDERCVKCEALDEEAGEIVEGNDSDECEELFEIAPDTFFCEETKTFTPGDLVGQAAAKAAFTDIDWLVNLTSKSELGAYLAAITNALINRVVKEGLSMVKGVLSANEQNNPPRYLPSGRTPDTSISSASVESITFDDGSTESLITLEVAETDEIAITIEGRESTTGQLVPLSNFSVSAANDNPAAAAVAPDYQTTNSQGRAIFSVMGLEEGSAIISFQAGSQTATLSISITASTYKPDEDEEETPTDTTPPNISITSPQDNATVSGTITISADASDNSGIKEVIFYLDGIQISVVTTPPYQISFDTNTMENGQHSIKATAIDSANNQTDYSIIVDTQNTISE
ncbi:MAG: hypothetical protein A3F21_00045 [Candidatus Portnoybacteria bacterium RIFCSPLOWO2_01_FULL_38_39]|nr:MAG: hypothetical protein A3F21_00045 [Candidatus Portnoybacteria bacterium RIFCSPLOWO2_01_FULL_38_39]